MGADDSISYHDAEEPTRSNASTPSGDNRRLGNAQSERTSEVFLTADDFLTSDDVSSQEGSSGSGGEEFASPAASARWAAAGLSAEAFRQQMLAEELQRSAQQLDEASQGAEGDVMYSAPNTPSAAQTPQHAPAPAPCLDAEHSPREAPEDHWMACLAKRTVLNKTFVRTRAASGSGARVGTSFVTLQQLEHACGVAAGASEDGRHALLDACRLVPGAVECAAHEPAPKVYGWHLKPDKRELLKSFSRHHAGSARMEISSRSGAAHARPSHAPHTPLPCARALSEEIRSRPRPKIARQIPGDLAPNP